LTSGAVAAFSVAARRHPCDISWSMSAVLPSTLWAIVANPRGVPGAIRVASKVVVKLGIRGTRSVGG